MSLKSHTSLPGSISGLVSAKPVERQESVKSYDSGSENFIFGNDWESPSSKVVHADQRDSHAELFDSDNEEEGQSAMRPRVDVEALERMVLEQHIDTGLAHQHPHAYARSHAHGQHPVPIRSVRQSFVSVSMSVVDETAHNLHDDSERVLERSRAEELKPRAAAESELEQKNQWRNGVLEEYKEEDPGSSDMSGGARGSSAPADQVVTV